MTSSEDENAFTKILTTAPKNVQKDSTGGPSWLEKRRRTLSLSGDGLMTCPSCRGSGVKDASTELVALIPYNDERLKPRNTKCKMAFALLVCAVIVGVSIYVFLPGKVLVTTTNITIVSASFGDYSDDLSSFDLYDSTKSCRSNITWKVDVTVENKNRFLPITVTELKVNLTWDVSNQIDIGYLVQGNFTIGGHKKNTTSYLIKTPQRPTTGNYSDLLLNCKCCRQFSHDQGRMWMWSTLALHYTLHVGRFNYFSSFVNSQKLLHDNCNYFHNMDHGTGKNITCETFNTCYNPHVYGGAGILDDKF